MLDPDTSEYYNMDVLDIIIPTDNTALATLTTNAATATVSRTTTKVSQETSIDIDMTFPTRMLDGSFIQVSIPFSQFEKTGASILYQEWNGSGYDTAKAITSVSEDSN